MHIVFLHNRGPAFASRDNTEVRNDTHGVDNERWRDDMKSTEFKL